MRFYFFTLITLGFVFFISWNYAGATVTSSTIEAVSGVEANFIVGTTDAQYNVAFETNNTDEATTITVAFPSGYLITNGNIAGVRGGTPICNQNCVFTNQITIDGGGGSASVDSVVGSSSARSITINLGSPAIFSGGYVSFRLLLGIQNATTSGLTGNFQLTTNAPGEVAKTDIAGVTLLAGTMGLAFTRQPVDAVSGEFLRTQPVIKVQDQYGNVSTTFTEVISLSTTASGQLVNATKTAVSGVATFSNLIYNPTDNQDLTLIANDEDAVGTDLSTTSSVSFSAHYGNLSTRKGSGGGIYKPVVFSSAPSVSESVTAAEETAVPQETAASRETSISEEKPNPQIQILNSLISKLTNLINLLKLLINSQL